MPTESLFPDPDIAALRHHLAKLRQARGYSYDELAARSGIARSTLVYLESGASNRNPDKPATTGTLTTWYHLARALEVPLDELLAPLLTEN